VYIVTHIHKHLFLLVVYILPFKRVKHSIAWILLYLSLISPNLSSSLSFVLHRSLSVMGSNFHYTIDLNEDQNHQPFFASLGSSLHHHLQQQQQQQQHFHHQASSNPSSLMSPSLSYFPFLINSRQDQVYVGYNNNTFHDVLDTHISQPLEV